MGDLSPAAYNFLVTAHATLMQFWLGPSILLAAFGSFLVPSWSGSSGMRFPRMHRASFYLLLVATLLLAAGILAPGEGALAPARVAHGFTTRFALLWTAAVTFQLAAFSLLTLNFLATFWCGGRLGGLPISAVSLAVSSLLYCATSTALALRGAEWLVRGQIEEGGPPFWRNLFVFFGQPLLCVLLLPALGIVAEILEERAGRRFAPKWATLGLAAATGIAVFAVWAADQLLADFTPVPALLRRTSAWATTIFSVPIALFFIRAAALLRQAGPRPKPAGLFAFGFVAELFVGSISGVMLHWPGVFRALHETEFVLAHFHFTLGPVALFATFAAIYHWFPRLSDRELDERLGRFHFAGTWLFFNGVFLPLLYVGALGDARRQAAFPSPDLLREFWRGFATLSLVGLLLSQLPFLYNLALTTADRRRV